MSASFYVYSRYCRYQRTYGRLTVLLVHVLYDIQNHAHVVGISMVSLSPHVIAALESYINPIIETLEDHVSGLLLQEYSPVC